MIIEDDISEENSKSHAFLRGYFEHTLNHIASQVGLDCRTATATETMDAVTEMAREYRRLVREHDCRESDSA